MNFLRKASFSPLIVKTPAALMGLAATTHTVMGT